jgi:hypothetical protein
LIVAQVLLSRNSLLDLQGGIEVWSVGFVEMDAEADEVINHCLPFYLLQ